jgi:hypothetical protein
MPGIKKLRIRRDLPKRSAYPEPCPEEVNVYTTKLGDTGFRLSLSRIGILRVEIDIDLEGP